MALTVCTKTHKYPFDKDSGITWSLGLYHCWEIEWAKTFDQVFFHKSLQKSLNKLFGQPNGTPKPCIKAQDQGISACQSVTTEHYAKGWPCLHRNLFQQLCSLSLYRLSPPPYELFLLDLCMCLVLSQIKKTQPILNPHYLPVSYLSATV